MECIETTAQHHNLGALLPQNMRLEQSLKGNRKFNSSRKLKCAM